MLKRLDFLGERVGYRINGSSSFKMPTGGFLSIYLVVVSISLTIFYCIPFITRETPKTIILQDTKIPFPPIVNMHDDGLLIATQLYFSNSTYNVPMRQIIKDFNLDFQYQNWTNTTNVIETPLEYSFCNEQNASQLRFFYQNLDIDNFLCLNITPEILLSGSLISPASSQVSFQINLKNRDPAYVKYIKSYFQNFTANLIFYFSDLSIDVNNLHSPLNQIAASYTSYFDFDTVKTINMELATVNTDSSYFIEDNFQVDKKPIQQNIMESTSNRNTDLPLTLVQTMILNTPGL
jgi:hypothetical protein